MPEAAIQIEHLVKRYAGPNGGVLAVDGVNLRVAAGELFGLLGPNGAGKTTTVGVCTTRVRPTAGQVHVGGVDVVADPPRARAGIGVVTQYRALDRGATAWENLYFHCRYFGWPAAASRRRADQLLAEFQLADRRDARPDSFSGGMAQRLQIARAVAHRPGVLFLDEPTAGLDPQSRLAVWELVQRLRAGGITVLLTTHYIEEAERLCDQVAIMDHGKILVCDSPARLKQSTGAGAVARVSVEHPGAELEARLRALPGVIQVEPVAEGYRLRARARDGLAPAVAAAAQSFGLRDFAVHEPSLETIFIHLTGRELRD
ncbi:MAG: ATP-binding cassette domain-containing protein [Terriglobales bacterium]